MIVIHIEYVTRLDFTFSTFWNQLDEPSQLVFLNRANGIEEAFQGPRDALLEAHKEAGHVTCQFLFGVREAERDYARRPIDWVDFVGDESAKKQLDAHMSAELESFVRDKPWYFYGGVKPLTSLDRKVKRQNERTGVDGTFRDMWDVVRFRIVVPTICELRSAAIAVWSKWSYGVVRCRNYYMHPKFNDYNDPYRAIHFEIEILAGRWVELQLLTEIRNTVGHLDFDMLFRKTIEPLSPEHLEWLWEFSLKSNIRDVQICEAELAG